MANDKTKRSEIEFSIEKWMAEMKARRGEENYYFSTRTTSVYKAPVFLRERNPKAFTPELVSFGPLHHGNPQLKPMEVHKERAFIDFILEATDHSLQNIVGEVYKIIKELRYAYSFLDDIWKTDDEAFFKMMIVDGFFMLHILILYEFAEDRLGLRRYQFPRAHHYSRFFHMVPYIIRDMMLIENQLPLFLLEALVPFLDPPKRLAKDIINSFVLKFVEADISSTARTTMQGLHLLDIFRESLQSPNVSLPALPAVVPVKDYIPIGVIRCAVELQEEGVRFIKSKRKDIRDIRFNPKTGRFYLPFLVVDNAMLNLIAFEHLHREGDQYVTSYICLLDEIINSANDVSLLQREGIILNKLGSDDEVVMLLNSMGKETAMKMVANEGSRQIYATKMLQVRGQVFQYCQNKTNIRKKTNIWKTSFIHTYFKSPWTVISLAGALIAIVLTLIQTIYSVRGN